jgi:hypothetical protein
VRVSWVLREPKYFTGGESDADLFKLTLTQLLSPSGVEVVSLVQWAFDWLYRLRFWRAGIADWLPRKRMDIHTKQVSDWIGPEDATFVIGSTGNAS